MLITISFWILSIVMIATTIFVFWAWDGSKMERFFIVESDGLNGLSIDYDFTCVWDCIRHSHIYLIFAPVAEVVLAAGS